MKKLLFWFELLRAYALPMSFMAWLIPFCYGLKNHGNILYGIIALVGIILVHLGANLFDDVIDYKRFLKNKQQNSAMNLKKGKCKFFEDGTVTIKKALLISSGLFFTASLIGLFFIFVYKLPIVILMLITGVLCLLYPKSGYFGLSEIIISTVYSPLLFTGVYYVMTGTYSKSLEWMSISFALVTLTLLYTDFFLDYNSDKEGGKKTIPVLCGSKRNAYYLFIAIIIAIYSITFIGTFIKILPIKALWILVSIPESIILIKNIKRYINKDIEFEGEFMLLMNDVQKYIALYTILCIIGIF